MLIAPHTGGSLPARPAPCAACGQQRLVSSRLVSRFSRERRSFSAENAKILQGRRREHMETFLLQQLESFGPWRSSSQPADREEVVLGAFRSFMAGFFRKPTARF